MLVTPAPVCLLIFGSELGKLDSFAMVLCVVRTIRLIFTTIPLMIVIVFCVVVGTNSRCCRRLAILGSQPYRHHRQWDYYKGGAQQGRIAETGHHYFDSSEKIVGYLRLGQLRK